MVELIMRLEKDMRVRFKKNPRTEGIVVHVADEGCTVLSLESMTSYMYTNKNVNEYIELLPDDSVIEWLDSLNKC
jgi:hypothetical protein